ncbi:MAG TPA: hypothetical protein VF210_14890 [Pseudomonadales bacterium]
MNDSIPRRPSWIARALARVALEIGAIVLGVLLALAVSEWQQAADDRERLSAALGNVRHELTENLALLQRLHAANSAMVQRLEQDYEPADGDVQYVPGVQVSEAAWRALGSTGLTNLIEYPMLLELSRTYATIDVYRRAGYALMDANLTMLATASAQRQRADDPDVQRTFATNFLGQFRLLTEIEAELIQAHHAALTALGAGVDPEAAPPPAER